MFKQSVKNLFKFSILLMVILFSCQENSEKINEDKLPSLTKLDSVKFSGYVKKAFQLELFSQERQIYLDSALMIRPQTAYLWQQKAMPLYKARKYSLGKPFLDKAVQYNHQKYSDYSAFMKCIFSKEYEESIKEFKVVKAKYGDSYVMDHTYNFYVALSYLQLNKFEEAKAFLLKSKVQQFADFPDDTPEEGCHYLDWFYLGVANYELGNYSESINNLELCLKTYTNFGEAMYLMSKCYKKLGEDEKSLLFAEDANKNKHNTINEDNVFYEVYPYQIFHKLLLDN